MSQKTAPTYTPPAPVYAMSGAEGQQQGYNLAQQEYGPQMGAQAQGIADIGQGAGYYNNFGPSTLADAVGNSYMQNVLPQSIAASNNSFANSGMINSPAAAATAGLITGQVGTNIGEYEQGVSNQNATNNLGQLMSINPMTYSQPLTNSILNQSNTNTQEQNAYNQALAYQQYQQQYNKYAQQAATAQTIGSISPVGGQIYGGMTGQSSSGLAGTMSTLVSPSSALAMNQMMQQYQMQPGVQGGGGSSSMSGASTGQGYSNGASSGYGMPSGSSIASSLPNMMAMAGGG